MWTRFYDMHSGGGSKESWDVIYIEAPEVAAKEAFSARFGHSPDRVTCNCCGEDYSVSEYPTLDAAREGDTKEGLVITAAELVAAYAARLSGAAP